MRVRRPVLGAVLQIGSLAGAQIALLLTAALQIPFAHLLVLPVLLLAGLGFAHGRRLKRPSAEEELIRDPRPPILYLRSFSRDELPIERPLLWLQLLLSPPWDQMRLWPKLTFEEALANVLRRFGPVIALGDPELALEPEGAARMYAGADWKHRVSAAAKRSALVVIMPEDRPALRWELKRIAKRPGLGRTLVVAPPLHRGEQWDDWHDEWTALREDFVFLPEVDEHVAAIQFDGTGAAQPIVAKSTKPHDRLRAIESALWKHTALHGVTSLRARAGWWLRHAAFALCWYLGAPVLLAVPMVWGLTPTAGEASRTGALRTFIGEQTIPSVIIFATLLALLARLFRSDLPLARVVRIGVEIDPVRAYAPIRRAARVGWVWSGVVLAIALKAFFLEAFKIPSGSMIPTLMIGDHIFVNKLSYGPLVPETDQRLFSRLPPARADVMVFKFPENKEQDFIKRVIATPGDTLEAINGRPVINGRLVPHCYVGPFHYENRTAELYVEFLGDKSYFTLFDVSPDEQTCGPGEDCDVGLNCRGGICGTLQGPFKVAPDEVWVMGDNRNNSHDSRSWRGGLGAGVPFENIKGRAMFVWMSFGPGGGIEQDRLFVNVLGRPKLPAPQEAALGPAVDKCLRERPAIAETTPPAPR